MLLHTYPSRMILAWPIAFEFYDSVICILIKYGYNDLN